MQAAVKTTTDVWKELLTARWEQAAAKAALLVAEFPEEKFDTRPADGVRTFAEVVRHLAFWNQYVADVLRGRKADDTTNDLPASRYPTKARIVEVLSQSSRDVVDAIRSQIMLDQKAVELVLSFVEHTCEHYGQMAVYSRLAGVVPPASRGA